MGLFEFDIDDMGPFIAGIINLNRVDIVYLEDDSELTIHMGGSKHAHRFSGDTARRIWNALHEMHGKSQAVTETSSV